METKQESQQIIESLRREIREGESAVLKLRASILEHQGVHGYAKHIEYLEDEVAQTERRVVVAAEELLRRTGKGVPRRPGRPPKDASNLSS